MNKNYIPVIDGLRALAVFIVFLFHLKIPGFGGGFIGVDIFFLISGYLITSIYFYEIKKTKNLTSQTILFLSYLKRRIYRLLPALIFVILLSLFAGYLILSPFDLIYTAKSSIYSSLFLSNIFFFLESSYWANLNEYKIFIHTWSLGIEMSFYLLMPFFLFLIYRFNNNKIIFICFVSIILSFVLIIIFISKGPTIESVYFNRIFYGKNISDILFYLIPFRFFEFIFGSAVFFFPKTTLSRTAQQILFIFGILLILFTMTLIDANHKYQSVIVSIALLGSSLIIYFKDAYMVNKLFDNKIFIFIGLISYSLYLVHWPIISFFKYIFLVELNGFLKLLIIILSIMLSSLIYKYIEIPFKNKNFKLRAHSIVISLFFILIFSLLIKNNDGFVNRLNSDQKILLSKISSTDSICNRKYSTVYKLRYKICVDGNEKNSNIIVLGDSNATTWFPISQKIANKLNSSVTNYRRVCNSFPKATVLNCYEIDPRAKILIIGSLWYTWQSKEENIKSDTLRYINNINDLSKNKNFKEIEKIIIFGQIPALKNNNLSIKSCLFKPKFYFKYQNCEKIYNHINDSENNLKKYEEVNKYLELYGNQILTKKFKFLFIDPIKSLCDSNGCMQYKDNEIFYYNNNHLSKAAVNYIYEDFKKEIDNFLE